MHTVLFLCTGNYYRSRFSEYLFNHWAEKQVLDWRADSRGLAVRPDSNNVGPVSKYTRARLTQYGISLPTDLRYPQSVNEADLVAAHKVIAVDASEHRPLMQNQFPNWEASIEYWMIHDIDRVVPDAALDQLEQHLQKLLTQIS
jgi:protein-tyrosine phosphatase